MKNFFILILFLFSFLLFGNNKNEKNLDQNEVLGYWIGYKDNTNLKNSIIYVYKYKNEVYARILAVIKDGKIYDSENLSGIKVKGFKDKSVEGLDFIWKLKYSKKSRKWDGGKIIDPKNGKIYSAEMKVDLDTGNLITKGKVWIFGRTKIWTRAKEDEIPRKIDVENLIPDYVLLVKK